MSDRGRPYQRARRSTRHAMDDTGRVLSRAQELAQEFLAGLGERPVWPRATFERDARAAFDGPLPEAGADPVAVVERAGRRRPTRGWPGRRARGSSAS